MMKSKNEEWLTCSCCGNGLRNTPEENADYGMNSFDNGFGMCMACGDWSYTIFMEARFPIVEKLLKPEQLEKWKTWTFNMKAKLVGKLIEKGAII